MEAEESAGRGLPTSFLEILPYEVLDNVLLHFSRIPEAKNWERHILLHDLVALFRVRSQLGSLMKCRFTALCVSNTGDCDSEKNEYRWELPTEGMVSTNDISVAREYILAGGGEALRTLAVGMGMYREEKDGVDIVDDFANNCPNVTSLSVHDMGPSWVSRFGKRLKKLEFSTFSTRGIAQHCSSLHELNLNLYSRSTNTGDADLWEKVGENLEKLTLKCVDKVPVDRLQNIGKYCRKIRHLDFFGSVHSQVQVSKLLRSYGDQLESAYIYDMDDAELESIMGACTNCRFHLRPSPRKPVLPSIRILGHQLESAHADYRYLNSQERDFDGFKKAWDGCVNLRRLLLKGCDAEDMKALMATPKTHLKFVSIRLWQLEKPAVKDVLDLCSIGCENIEELAYHGPHLPIDAFDNFIEKDSFRSIFLSLNANYEKHLDIIVPFVTASVTTELILVGAVPEKVMRKLVDCGVLVRGGYGIPRYLE